MDKAELEKALALARLALADKEASAESGQPKWRHWDEKDIELLAEALLFVVEDKKRWPMNHPWDD